ncbi:hypothetical protein DASC09_055790 [Saccharomycopsis crataegensis]|uniref:Uncharacterized protein n=1 Tax=Saccharomycopsis crataegensis TaxID=43959 RepID=A0AAV5QVN2_9ASCO|nr:hypothetical protein DASC09_055790 [Saccharomycopsis crataegensis]
MSQKTALITGAGGGIGSALCKVYAKNGYKVFAIDIKFPEEVAAKFKELEIITFHTDVTKSEQIVDLRQKLVEEFGLTQLDVLYNNAGVASSLPAIDYYDSALEFVNGVNFLAPIKFVREFSKLIIKAKGTIVFTTSVTGWVPLTFNSVYAATKAGLDQYARTLNSEMKPLGVKVISMVTGAVDTTIGTPTDLPKDSIFNTPEVHEHMKWKRALLKNENAMDPEVYAERAYNQLNKATLNNFRLFEGKRASTYYTMFRLLPVQMMNDFIRKRFRSITVYPSVFKKLEAESGK